MSETKYLEQLEATLNGKQNFCIIEERKAPLLYRLLVESPSLLEGPDSTEWIAQYNKSDEGNEVVVHPVGGDELQKYLNLMEYRDVMTRERFQTEMGRILGYSDEDIEWWINEGWPECQCECSKCGGPIEEEEPESNIVFGTVSHEGTRPYQHLYYKGQPYGTLYHPDPVLVANSPGIQTWSKP